MLLSIFSKREGENKPRRNRGCLWTILIFVVVYMAIGALTSMMMVDMMKPSARLEDHTIYQLQMNGIVVEQGQEANPFASFMSEMPMGGRGIDKVGLDDLKKNIQLAAEDSKIKGILLRGGEMSMGPASAKALRDALADFKKSGKFLIAYAENYDQLNYYVASVADQIYLNPVGVVSWNGLTAQKLYFKRLLDKVGVEMQIVKVGTFKSAVEPYSRTSMSDDDRKQTLLYLEGIWSEMRTAVSQSRGINEAQLDSLANKCMLLQPQEDYLTSGLIDSLIYVEDLDIILKQLMEKDDYQTISTAKLATVKRVEHKAEKKIAVVYAEGDITDDTGSGIVGKKMVKMLQKIKKDDDIKAVVLRVNSPGGSASASEQIWHAVTQVQMSGKPVVVSMGDYAASGGYYISSSADYIFAEPTTLTGSIGIFGMIPSFSTLRNNVGLDIDGVSTHNHAAINSNLTYRGMNAEERILMQNMINRGYDLFTKRCADGRKMTQDEIRAIGEGRVWLGINALELGLVDELGGMEKAICKAADMANMTDYELSYYPEKKDFMTEFVELLDNSTEEERLLMSVKEFCSRPRVLTLMDRVEIE